MSKISLQGIGMAAIPKASNDYHCEIKFEYGLFERIIKMTTKYNEVGFFELDHRTETCRPKLHFTIRLKMLRLG